MGFFRHLSLKHENHENDGNVRREAPLGAPFGGAEGRFAPG